MFSFTHAKENKKSILSTSIDTDEMFVSTEYIKTCVEAN